MLRLLATMLLLLNYLLVVGTGCVGRDDAWERHKPQRAYVHSDNCQRDNYLRLDCFDRCNGNVQLVHQQLPADDAWQHVLTQGKGLDLHCLAETAVLRPRFISRRTRPTYARWVPALLVGERNKLEAPPRRG